MKTYRKLFRVVLLCCAAGLTTDLFAHGPDDQAVTITELFKRAHPEDKDRDVILQRIELAPGASARPHVHPGMVTGYVISGTLEFQLAGEPLRTLRAGDTFFEVPGSKHVVARNPNASEKTVLIAFVINPKNQAVAQPLEAAKPVENR